MFLSKFYKDPIFHFCIFGVLVYSFISSQDSSKMLNRNIIVDQSSLMQFIQYQSKAFEPSVAINIFNDMTVLEKEQLIDTFIYEEALYQEAVALGFGINDYVIRQRMVQKVEFLSGAATQTLEPSEAQVRSFYNKNPDLYVQPAKITFTHVFFPLKDGGEDQMRAKAHAMLTLLRAKGVSFSDSTKYGSRYLYGHNFVEKSFEDIQNTFGSSVAEKLFSNTLKRGEWNEPIMSQYGAHLFYIRSLKPARHLLFADVSSRVKSDFIRMRDDDNRRDTIQSIVKSYTPRIVWEPALVGKYEHR